MSGQGVILALALAAAPVGADEASCWPMLDAADVRVAELEAEVRALRRRLEARTGTTTAQVCAPSLVCPSVKSCEREFQFNALDAIIFTGAFTLGAVFRGSMCSAGGP